MENSTGKPSSQQPSRRNFLKNVALLGVTLGVGTALGGDKVSQSPQSVLVDAGKDGKQNLPLRRLGSGATSLTVSALGFGVMGMNYHRGPHPDKKAAIRLLHHAVERGITLFDTAETYGPFTNEELAGEALSQYRDTVAITTKFGFEYDGDKTIGLDSRQDTIRKVAESSLRRLKIDAIDLFYQHRFDPSVPIEDVAGTLQELIREGKIKQYGLCEVGPDIIRKAHAVHPVTAIQSEYHLMWRKPEEDVLPVCEELGIGFVPYSPVNRGLLCGSLNEFTNFNNGNDNRVGLPRFQPEAIRQNMRFVEGVIEFGRTRGMTSAQVALAWLLAKKPWIVPIPGTTKHSHLEENLYTLTMPMSNADITELERILSPIPIIGDRYPSQPPR